MGDRFWALILILMGWPLFLIIAILIKIDSNGPIFFRQERFGYKEKIFICLKFRTMYVFAPKNANKKEMMGRDDFITPVGKWLRIFSFDELPQLFNIFYGQMKFIGPRPNLISDKELHRLRQENDIYGIKPGITGWAQIKQYGGEKKRLMCPREQVAADKFYLDNASFNLDMKIFWQTILIAVGGKNSLVMPAIEK